MFIASFSRYAQQVLDLKALELLPEPGSGRPPALRPASTDEGRHEPGAEQLWNESWYFDLVSDDGSTGLYTRLGLYPNLGVSWITAFVCGAQRPTVAIIDFAAPLPAGEELSVAGEHALIEHECEAPLERFRVRLQGSGEVFEDPAGLLRGERGEPIEVSFDLVWETLGDPYAYRVTTRYEIPCRVNGTLTLAGESIALGGYGQRDHSWGTRDWWSAEWVWSACRLDDGTRLHGVEFRLPGAPPPGKAILQRARDIALGQKIGGASKVHLSLPCSQGRDMKISRCDLTGTFRFVQAANARLWMVKRRILPKSRKRCCSALSTRLQIPATLFSTLSVEPARQPWPQNGSGATLSQSTASGIILQSPKKELQKLNLPCSKPRWT